MPRHKRTRTEHPRLHPNRRIFVLQLYGNGFDRPRAGKRNFEAEAKVLDQLAKRIDMMLNFGDDGATTIRHDNDSFHCYVGTNPQDKALIVKPRTYSALDWTTFRRIHWCRDVANSWCEASGYPPLDFNDHPPLDGNDSTTTSRDEGRVAGSTLTTARRDAQT